MKVLIIEDEYFAVEELKRLLKRCDLEIEVLASLDTIRSSVEWFRTHPKPDLVFMDVQLSDGLSFEIFNKADVSCPLVFTTAYDEYAIQAFKVNSIDYLLKPIELQDLKSALHKYQTIKNEFMEGQASFTANQIESLLNFGKVEYKNRFVSKVGDYLKYILIKDVAYFYAEDKTVYLVSIHDKKYILDYSLDQLAPQLDPKKFFRLNRQYITKLNAIESVAKYFNGRLQVTLNPTSKDQITVSREKARQFKDWLEG